MGLSNLIGLKLRDSSGSGDFDLLEEGVGEDDTTWGLTEFSGGLNANFGGDETVNMSERAQGYGVLRKGILDSIRLCCGEL